MILDKEFILNILNEKKFKKWLISKRWFGNKAFLHDLNFNISFEYFEPLSEQVFIQIINISKNEYSRSYFFPIACFSNLKEINFLKEENHKNIQSIENHLFEGKIIILEAEFSFIFWKEILKNLDIDVSFKNPENFIFTLNQLGNDNTTNLLFSLLVQNKYKSEKLTRSYLLKSYKLYLENLEIIKLSILNNNDYQNVPKVFGTFKIKDINVIGIMEVLQNKGNIGDIYWNELNDLYTNIQHVEQENNLLSNEKECYRLMNYYCVESIRIASQIGKLMIPFWRSLIKPEDLNYSVLKIDILEFFKDLEKKVNHDISHIEENINKLDESAISYQFDNYKILDDLDLILEIFQNLMSKNEVKTLKIQPIHQDLHMEQILYNKINGNYDFFILDLEGDPQLSIKERQKKQPIEKDIAYFLRSLSYIKFNTLLNHAKKKENVISALLLNNQDMLLKAYLSILDTWEFHIKQLILENINTNKILMELFTIERILNEINYELQFRPRNLIVPIIGLHEFINKHQS